MCYSHVWGSRHLLGHLHPPLGHYLKPVLDHSILVVLGLFDTCTPYLWALPQHHKRICAFHWGYFYRACAESPVIPSVNPFHLSMCHWRITWNMSDSSKWSSLPNNCVDQIPWFSKTYQSWSSFPLPYVPITFLRVDTAILSQSVLTLIHLLVSWLIMSCSYWTNLNVLMMSDNWEYFSLSHRCHISTRSLQLVFDLKHKGSGYFQEADYF